MGQEFPGNTSPAGKPSITSRATTKSMGSFSTAATGGGEVRQVTFSTKGSSGGANAASKGSFSLAPATGKEYRTNTSKD